MYLSGSFPPARAPQKPAQLVTWEGVGSKGSKDSITRWGDSECRDNMLAKADTDPRFLRLKDQLGPRYPAFIKSVFTPSVQLYCECAASSISSGDSMSQMIGTCRQVMETDIKTRTDAFMDGYQ